MYPARYQSDAVDRRNGKLVRSRNRALRHAILLIADNLMHCNAYFQGLAEQWKKAGQDVRAIHVKVADRFCRIAYQIVAGRQAFRHPCCTRWDYVVEKIIDFAIEHADASDFSINLLI